MRYMGIDYGEKRVGVAFSDELGTMGFPFEVLPNDAKLAEALALLVESQHIGTIVIGESKDLYGNDNPIANPARALGEELSERTGVPVAYENEQYTSELARRFPDGSRNSSREAVDAKAAALILTSYLEKHGGQH